MRRAVDAVGGVVMFVVMLGVEAAGSALDRRRERQAASAARKREGGTR